MLQSQPTGQHDWHVAEFYAWLAHDEAVSALIDAETDRLTRFNARLDAASLALRLILP